MYKISINDHPFYLLKSDEVDSFRSRGYTVLPYPGKKSSLIKTIEQLENSEEELRIAYFSDDDKKLKNDFKSSYKRIRAMGGIVINPRGEVLFIYRRGMWDLPKGKIEKDESKKECAVREVREETGLENIHLKSRVGKTRHTYRDPVSGERILKITTWYEMAVPGDEELILQQEEGIEDAKWMTIGAFLEGNYVTFANIKDILNEYRSMAVGTE